MGLALLRKVRSLRTVRTHCHMIQRPKLDAFIGYCTTHKEAKLYQRVLEASGVPARVGRSQDRPAFYRNYTLWVSSDHEQRGREVRRGFKAGLVLQGDTFDFLIGLRCALQLQGGKHGPAVSSTPDERTG